MSRIYCMVRSPPRVRFPSATKYLTPLTLTYTLVTTNLLCVPTGLRLFVKFVALGFTSREWVKSYGFQFFFCLVYFPRANPLSGGLSRAPLHLFARTDLGNAGISGGTVTERSPDKATFLRRCRRSQPGRRTHSARAPRTPSPHVWGTKKFETTSKVLCGRRG